MPDSVVRRITWRTADVAQLLLLALLFAFIWRFFWMVYTAIFIALIAILLAIVLHAPAKFFARWIPFQAAFAGVVLLFLASIAGLLVAIIPQILEQIGQLARELPHALNAAGDWLSERSGIERNDQLTRGVNDQIAEFVGRFVPVAFNLVTTLVGSTAVVILAIFLAYSPETYRDVLIRMTPPAARPKMERVYSESGTSLRNWVLGKAITMVAVGITVWIGLILFGIPGALALGALAAVLEFIPNLGPTLAAAPAVVAAFLISPATALWVVVFYIVMQQVQSALTVPLVERRAVNIPSAALLIWQLMLAVGFGILGLFVATPLLALLVGIFRIFYLEPAEERFANDRRETGDGSAPAEGTAPGPSKIASALESDLG